MYVYCMLWVDWWFRSDIQQFSDDQNQCGFFLVFFFTWCATLALTQHVICKVISNLTIVKKYICLQHVVERNYNLTKNVNTQAQNIGWFVLYFCCVCEDITSCATRYLVQMMICGHHGNYSKASKGFFSKWKAAMVGFSRRRRRRRRLLLLLSHATNLFLCGHERVKRLSGETTHAFIWTQRHQRNGALLASSACSIQSAAAAQLLLIQYKKSLVGRI